MGDAGTDDAYFGNHDPEPQPHPQHEELAPPATPVTEQPPTIPRRAAHHARLRPNREQSAIRLRRLRGLTPPSRPGPIPPLQRVEQGTPGGSGRRRSSSEPHQPSFPPGTPLTPLPSLSEVATAPAPAVIAVPRGAPAQGRHRFGRRRRTPPSNPPEQPPAEDCYDSRIVDFLDVVDPEVATLSSITNIQNSLFIPSLGKWINRRPTYDLSHMPEIPGAFPVSQEDVTAYEHSEGAQGPPGTRSPSLSSVLSQPQYAILPKDASLQGWREEDVKVLNDYVRHMLHSRRSKIKQRFKAFLKYASRPLGFLVTLYATLITLFGLAWVLFLIGWIYVGEKQLYIINVIDYVLVALFAIVGDGLAPFRAVDTYHMIFVAHYHRKTWKQRQKLLLPNLQDHNDLPTANGDSDGAVTSDLEAQSKHESQDDDGEFFPVLSDKQQARLEHHQAKLAKSHTFYKPHETETHRAFPLRLLITVVVLLDLHSCLQIALGACTWGIPYEVRPAAVTTTILCCSIATNIAAAIFISIGDRRTRKRDVLERLLKQDLTEEAMRKIRKKKDKEARKDEATDDEEEGRASSATRSIPSWVEKRKKGKSSDKNGGASGNKSDWGEKSTRDRAALRVPGGLPRTEEEA